MKVGFKNILIILLVLIIIGIIYVNCKYGKQKKYNFQKSKNDNILNNTGDGFNNYLPIGEVPNVKHFSTFVPNIELFNKNTKFFNKKVPYVFLKKSIKEGVCANSIESDLDKIFETSTGNQDGDDLTGTSTDTSCHAKLNKVLTEKICVITKKDELNVEADSQADKVKTLKKIKFITVPSNEDNADKLWDPNNELVDYEVDCETDIN